MNRDNLDRWCERGILGLILAILIYGPLATGAVRVPDFLVIQGLTMGVMLLWVLRLWLNPRPKFLWPPICWAVLAFTAYVVVRYLTADIEYVARLELIRVLIYAFLFFAILNNLHRQESTQIISFTMICLAMAISFYAIYQFLTDSNRVWDFIKPYAHRGSGTYISPNNLAGFLEMLLPLGLAYTLVGRGKPVTKILLGYASLVILAGIGVTVSRGGWLSTALALLIFFGVVAFRRNYRLPALVLFLVIVCVGIYFVPRSYFFQSRLKQVYENGQVDDNARFALWKPAIQMWEKNIWWGVGPAHFNYRFREFRPQSIQRDPDWTHNDYLNTLADYGIAGTALVLAAWLLLAWGVFKTWRSVHGAESDLGGRKSNKFAFVLGASIGLLAILFHSVVDFNMHIPANAILAITLMALLSGHFRFATERYWFSARLPTKTLASVILAAGFAYLCWQEWRRGSEYVWLQRAARQSEFSSAQADDLQKAFAIEPMDFETAYKIGEAYRAQSWESGANYRELAQKAMHWYEITMKLDPFDPYGYLRYGMCLDWLDQADKSWPYYDKANQLDPNGYYMVANVGWHFVQAGNYAAARAWFERSIHLQWQGNDIARNYLEIVNQRLLDAATNTSPFNLSLPNQ